MIYIAPLFLPFIILSRFSFSLCREYRSNASTALQKELEYLPFFAQYDERSAGGRNGLPISLHPSKAMKKETPSYSTGAINARKLHQSKGFKIQKAKTSSQPYYGNSTIQNQQGSKGKQTSQERRREVC